jgi:uncharacterized protein YuzE
MRSARRSWLAAMALSSQARAIAMQPTHDADFYAWAIDSAVRLRAGRVSEVDLASVAAALEDMEKAQKHALGEHLKSLVVRLLKWRYRPSFRGVSWRLSLSHTDTLSSALHGATITETRDRDNDNFVALDAAGSVCAIAIEHASERAEIPAFSYEQIAA